MTAQKGALVLIQIGDGGVPEIFGNIGGLATSRMTVNNQMVENTNRAAGQWRHILNNAGIQSIDIEGQGTFVGSAEEAAIRQCALTATVKNYRFHFADGDYLTGAFLVTFYERSGDIEDAEHYAIALSSAGPVTYTAS